MNDGFFELACSALTVVDRYEGVRLPVWWAVCGRPQPLAPAACPLPHPPGHLTGCAGGRGE